MIAGSVPVDSRVARGGNRVVRGGGSALFDSFFDGFFDKLDQTDPGRITTRADRADGETPPFDLDASLLREIAGGRGFVADDRPLHSAFADRDSAGERVHRTRTVVIVFASFQDWGPTVFRLRFGRVSGHTSAMTRNDFTALRGERIEAWAGVEMALREDVTGTGPHFADPDVPCLQLYSLQAWLDDGGAVDIGTYQDNEGFGLCSRSSTRSHDDGRWGGLYRWRSFPELPVGLVEHVAVFHEEDILAEAHFRIGTQPLVLLAGELEETHGGGLIFQRLDESVLAFTDPGAVDHSPWNTARRIRQVVCETPDV